MGLGYAVKDRGTSLATILYTSASQLQKADPSSTGGCLRKWWFHYVMGIKPDAGAWLSVGTDLHRENEHYLKTGERALSGLALSGLHLLPDPGPDLLIEQSINGVLIDGVPVVGQLDLAHARGTNKGTTDIMEQVDPPGTVEVHDHKTTKDWKYYPEPESLGFSTQMLAYGMYLSAVLTGVQWIRFSQGWYLTSRKNVPPARKCTTLVKASEVPERWQQNLPVIRSMKEAARCTSQSDVPANLGACDTYGGCTYRKSGLCEAAKPENQGLERMFALL